MMGDEGGCFPLVVKDLGVPFRQLGAVHLGCSLGWGRGENRGVGGVGPLIQQTALG